MYKSFLSVLATLFNTVGTILSIFSILKMRLKDIVSTVTWFGIETQDLSTLRQVFDARIGIMFVVIGAIIQIINELICNITCVAFCVVFGLSIGFIFVWVCIMYMIYKKNKRKLISEKSPDTQKELKKSERISTCEKHAGKDGR